MSSGVGKARHVNLPASWRPRDGGRPVHGQAVSIRRVCGGLSVVSVVWPSGSVGRFVVGRFPVELHVEALAA